MTNSSESKLQATGLTSLHASACSLSQDLHQPKLNAWKQNTQSIWSHKEEECPCAVLLRKTSHMSRQPWKKQLKMSSELHSNSYFWNKKYSLKNKWLKFSKIIMMYHHSIFFSIIYNPLPMPHAARVPMFKNKVALLIKNFRSKG